MPPKVNLPEYDFQVQFIFGAPTCRLLNLKAKMHMDLPLEKPVFEETFEEEFRNVVAAMQQAGILKKGDKVLCTTFPEGSKRFESGGEA